MGGRGLNLPLSVICTFRILYDTHVMLPLLELIMKLVQRCSLAPTQGLVLARDPHLLGLPAPSLALLSVATPRPGPGPASQPRPVSLEGSPVGEVSSSSTGLSLPSAVSPVHEMVAPPPQSNCKD